MNQSAQHIVQHLGRSAAFRKDESVRQQIVRWRRQAEDARQVASGLQSLEAIRVMRDVATTYERLAAYAEERAKALP